MDQQLPYEQLIASKLESLPIPDMEDMIWARVKAQLDIDMPEDDDNGTNGPQTPSGPGIIGWGLGIVVIALVTVFLLFKNKPAATTINNKTTPAQQITLPIEQTTAPPTGEAINRGNNTPLLQPSLQPTGTDSVVQPGVPIVETPVSDTAVINNIPPPLVVTSVAADTLPTVKKKSKGVAGISPNDYRIVPKKDSTNK